MVLHSNVSSRHFVQSKLALAFTGVCRTSSPFAYSILVDVLGPRYPRPTFVIMGLSHGMRRFSSIQINEFLWAPQPFVQS